MPTAPLLPRPDPRAVGLLIACVVGASVACTSPNSGTVVSGTATAMPPPAAASPAGPSGTAPAATPGTATPAPAPAAPPYRADFAPGEVVNVSPAVRFVDTSSGATTAWGFPAARDRFGVSPTGNYLVWSDGERIRVHRTDDETDRVIDAQRLPVAYGPGDAGFVALTQTPDAAALGTAAGEFCCNPRWSPDDKYLYVNAMPAFGGDLAYLFTADASRVWRYVSTRGASTDRATITATGALEMCGWTLSASASKTT